MVRFLGIIRQNKLETFCTFFCCLWQKILQVSSPAYKYFSSPVEEVALAQGEYLMVIHRSAMLGGPTQSIGKTFYLARTSSLNLIPDCRNQKLLMECFQQVHLLFNRQHNLIYCLSRRKFPTLFPPFHYQPALAQTYLSLFPQSHADCFIKKKNLSRSFLWKHHFEDCLCTTRKCLVCFFPFSHCCISLSFYKLTNFLQMKTLHISPGQSRKVTSIESYKVSQAHSTFPMMLIFTSVCFRTLPSEAIKAWNKKSSAWR